MKKICWKHVTILQIKCTGLDTDAGYLAIESKVIDNLKLFHYYGDREREKERRERSLHLWWGKSAAVDLRWETLVEITASLVETMRIGLMAVVFRRLG